MRTISYALREFRYRFAATVPPEAVKGALLGVLAVFGVRWLFAALVALGW